MTEPPHSERPDSEPPDDPVDETDPEEMHADELASAFVDGELSDEEAAQVRSNPELMDRVTEFEAVSAATSASPAPAPAAMKASHIAAAMAVFEAGTITETSNLAATSTIPEARPAAASSLDLTDGDPSDGDLTDRRQQRAERGNRMLLTLAAAFVVVAGIGLATLSLGSSSDDDVAIGSDDASAPQTTTVSASNAEAAGEALEAEALANDEAMDDEAMDDAMESEAAMDEAMADDSADAADSSEIIESDEESSDFDGDAETAEAAEPFGALRLADPPDALTIDDLFAQSATAEPLPIDESLCAAELGIADGFWFIVENADGSVAEFIVEIADDGAEIGRLVDQTCATVLE